MLGYDNYASPETFFFSFGSAFLILLFGFAGVVVVFRSLYKRAGRTVHNGATAKSKSCQVWVPAVFGPACVLGGLAGLWVGVVPGLIEQTLFTRTYPGVDYLVFEPIGLPSIIFGGMMCIFGFSVLGLGLLMVYLAWQNRQDNASGGEGPRLSPSPSGRRPG